MNALLVSTWNKSNQSVLDGKNPSTYAIEKEPLFPAQSLICDLGGGTGADACFFLSKGHPVILIDIADQALEAAKKKAEQDGHAERLQTYQVDLSEDTIPLPDHSVDVVYSRLAVHYFTYHRTIEIFKEIKRIVKPEGKAYITIKSPDDADEMAFLKQTAVEIEPGVYEKDNKVKSMYTTEQLQAILSEAGIDDASISSYTENLEESNDKAASGVKKLLLTEIIF